MEKMTKKLQLTDLSLHNDTLTFVMKDDDGQRNDMKLKFINDSASEFCFKTLSWSLKADGVFGEEKLDEIRAEGVEMKEGAQDSRRYYLCKNFLNCLTKNYQKERDVKFYAEQLHITPSYLFTVVRDYTGKSPSDIISKFVISNAKQLLERTNMNCKQIAFTMNFPNQSFFGKYFKKLTGMTPVEYRKQKRRIIK